MFQLFNPKATAIMSGVFIVFVFIISLNRNLKLKLELAHAR